jgi:hypothetical protein
LKEAAYQTAEANKIVRVKEAEALCETLHLHGVGVARQRQALTRGLQ